MIQVQTTTEELIVSYLDGELQRRELEVVLFERLATSEEARTLLREHLVLRGAIRSSAAAPQFELSSDLDKRTRARIEEMLRNVPVLEAVPVLERKMADAAPVATPTTTRSLKRWSLRPSYALAALLLAIGSTWLVTNAVTTDDQQQLASNNPPQVSTHTVPAQPEARGPETNDPEQSNNAISPSTQAAVQPAAVTEPAKERIIYKTVVKYVPATGTNTSAASNKNIASLNTDAHNSNAEEAPASVMISHRYNKLLKSTNVVAVTTEDRVSD